MGDKRIYCPHCKLVNEPLDDESTDILFTVMKCEHCEKEFDMSREIHIVYTTWS